MPKLIFEPEFACRIVYGQEPEWVVLKNEIVDQRRWVTIHEVVVKHLDKYYFTYYEVGSTEDVDKRPFDGEGTDEPILVEVFPVERTVTEYEEVKDWPKEITVYLSTSKETMFEKGQDLRLFDKALDHFKFPPVAKARLEVSEDGSYKILDINFAVES